MENASKALIMAGSILMSLMIVSSLIFMFGRLSDVEQTKVDAEEISKLVDYSQRFEQYNKIIYGSELLSLANLHEDYEKMQVETKGYETINISVTITRKIYGTTYFSKGTKNIKSICSDKNSVEDLIEQYEKTKNTEQYENMKLIYTEFKSKRFKCQRVDYNQAGRVSFMNFTEV